MRMLSRLTILALLTGLFAIPSARANTRVFVRIGPPPIVVEQAVPAPGYGYAWRPGYHRWEGTRYVWVNGMWVRPPYRHARWVEGRWARERHGYYWIEGRWVR
jgi:hypothetical protein